MIWQWRPMVSTRIIWLKQLNDTGKSNEISKFLQPNKFIELQRSATHRWYFDHWLGWTDAFNDQESFSSRHSGIFDRKGRWVSQASNIILLCQQCVMRSKSKTLFNPIIHDNVFHFVFIASIFLPSPHHIHHPNSFVFVTFEIFFWFVFLLGLHEISNWKIDYKNPNIRFINNGPRFKGEESMDRLFTILTDYPKNHSIQRWKTTSWNWSNCKLICRQTCGMAKCFTYW